MRMKSSMILNAANALPKERIAFFSEFDMGGQTAYRHDAVMTSWNEHGPEVASEPVPVSNYPQVPLDELRNNILMSPPDEIEDDVDKLLASMIDWDGLTLPPTFTSTA
jgi:hypothetical protein